MKTPISFLGTGKMAIALIDSILKSNPKIKIIASGRNKENLVKLKNKIKTTTNNVEAINNSDVIFLCVKPQDMDNLLGEIKSSIKNQLIVSIAAGLKLKYFESKLGNKRIIRVMPNVNYLVGEGAAGFCVNKNATKNDLEFIGKILNQSGIAFKVNEEHIDALSIISGAGPAFLAYFMKQIIEEAQKKGLSKEICEKLAYQTMLGTGKLMLEKNVDFDELIAMVASKKGITAEGLNVLEKRNVSKILKEMFDASYKRSREFGK